MMDRFPRYELALCSKRTTAKQEVEKDKVFTAAFLQRRRTRRELPLYIMARLSRVLKVNHDA